MNPILITNIPLLKAAFLLLMVIGFTHASHTNNCDTKVVKAVSIVSMCSDRFVRVNGSQVKADSKENYTIYTITHPKTTAFFLYDPQQSKFICFKDKKRKNMFVAKRIPKSSDLCLFEEIPAGLQHSPSSPYTVYRLYNKTQPHAQDFFEPCKNAHCLGVNRNGLQKLRKNIKCHQHDSYTFLKKKQNSAPCKEYHNNFCRRMTKLSHKHHHHMLPEILQICKQRKPL